MRLLVLLACAGALFAQGIPNIARVVNAASQDSRLSPGCLADIIGTSLGTDASVGVLVGGQHAAKVVSTSATRWRVWIPDSVGSGQTTIELGASALVPITLTQYSPALFSADGTGLGIVNAVGYRVNSNGALILPGYQLSETTPAKLGDYLILEVTGLGAPDRANEFIPMDPVSVKIGGQPALVPSAFLVTDQDQPGLLLWPLRALVLRGDGRAAGRPAGARSDHYADHRRRQQPDAHHSYQRYPPSERRP